MTRLVVTGGRFYGNEVLPNGDLSPKALRERDKLKQVLDSWFAHFSPGGLVLAHGGAGGADTLAGEWAKERHVECQVFEADWKSFGKLAGPLRNNRMLLEYDPHFVLAFPGGKGTEHCTQKAKMLKIPVVKVA